MRHPTIEEACTIAMWCNRITLIILTPLAFIAFLGFNVMLGVAVGISQTFENIANGYRYWWNKRDFV